MGKQDALPLVDMTQRTAILPEYEAPAAEPPPKRAARKRKYGEQVTLRLSRKQRQLLDRIKRQNKLDTRSQALRFALDCMA